LNVAKIDSVWCIMIFQQRILILLSVALLSACGGGDGADASLNQDTTVDSRNDPPEQPQGVPDAELDQHDETEGDMPEEPQDTVDGSSAEPELYTVSTRVTGEGAISPASQMLEKGRGFSFEVVPERHHRLATISGCNGQIEGAAYIVENLTAPCEISVQFEHEAIKETWTIEDPASAYNSQCERPAFFFAIPTDLNSDGNQDLIAHYWCGSESFGSVDKTPTGDALAALVNDGAGNFSLENTSVFGAPFAQLGGAARKYDRGDLNADGMVDFVFAMNWEDGRSSADANDIATEPSVLLSDSAGYYSLERLGSPDWGHATGIIKNPDGSQDALFAGFLHGTGLQAYSLDNGRWVDSSAAYPGVSWAVTIGTSEDSRGFTDHIFGSGGGATPSLDMFSRQNDSWVQTGTHEINRLFQVNWYAWNGNFEPVDVVCVNGEKYFMGSYFATCTMPNLFGNNERHLIGKVSGAAIHEEIVEGQFVKNHCMRFPATARPDRMEPGRNCKVLCMI